MALPLDDIVNVIVQLSGMPAPRSGFNIGAIIGESTVIPAEERVRLYSSTDAMLDDGFADDSAEHKAALLYFSQSPKPLKVIIGCKEESESWLQAVTACCGASTAFYCIYMCGAEKADIQAVAAYIEPLMRVLMYDTKDADVVSGADGNIFAALKALSYERSIGMYSTTDYAAAALMGFAMGANDGTVNSAYTLAYKTLKGVAPDALTENQLATIKGNNGNAYINRADVYNVFEQGYMANGEHFDTRIGLDQLANNMQLACTDLLVNTKTKIPQTESGMTQLKTAIAKECDKAVKTRFLAPGVWNQEDILNLKQGDTLAAGYLIQSERIDDQTPAERASRVAPGIYVAVKLAGAIEGVVIKVVVDR